MNTIMKSVAISSIFNAMVAAQSPVGDYCCAIYFEVRFDSRDGREETVCLDEGE